MKLYLLRHGETERNRDRRVQGRGDHSLTERGVGQARAAAKALSTENIQMLCASPLRRAMEMAAIIGEHLGLQPHSADGLAELDAGEMDGLNSQEMRSRHAEFMALWDKDPGDAQLPGGESLAQVQYRAWEWAEGAASEYPDSHVAVVSHNFTISMVICKVLEIPISSFRRFTVDLGSISAVEITPERRRLVLLNSTFHLNGQSIG